MVCVFSSSFSFSLKNDSKRPAQNKSSKPKDRQCLWCGLSSGKITPNGFHPECLEQFLALPEPCRTCSLIWIDVFLEPLGPPSTICLLWMRFPDDFCDAHKPWWRLKP